MGPGFPEWTEIGQDSGLDPLGMQRPIEVLFQSLLPGISTITLRLRYYSFLAWVLEKYEKANRSSDPGEFSVFHRRAEVLLALVCARSRDERGITGIDWAAKQVDALGANGGANTGIDFEEGANPESPREARYLRNKGGAFGAIYATQMAAMGLVELEDDKVRIPFCREAALPLAAAFENAIGSKATEFLEILENHDVTASELDALAIIKPSNIEPGSTEQELLVDALFGRLGSATPSGEARRETLKLVLAQARETGGKPSTEELKWAFLDLADEPGEGLSSEICETWALYQACDLQRLCYECLLSASLVTVRAGTGGRMSIDDAASRVGSMARLPSGKTFGELLADDGDKGSTRETAEAMLSALKTGDIEGMVISAAVLLAKLYRRSGFFSDQALEWLRVDDYFQSLVSETRYYQSLLDLPANAALAELTRERVIKRHLWVASRKLRAKAYTFLLEPDEGMLRYRKDFRISPSSPRLDQAIQFLEDGKLLSEGGITLIGERELAGQ